MRKSYIIVFLIACASVFNVLDVQAQGNAGNTPVCDETVSDGDNISYPVVTFAGHCWMSKNLTATSVVTSGNVYAYQSSQFPDEAGNVAAYGRLYDETAAMQGLCPEGWSLPTTTLFDYVKSHYAAAELRNNTGWINGGGNGTGFSWDASGMRNGTTERFENMLTEGYLWAIDTTGGVPQPAMYKMMYYCNEIVRVQDFGNISASVRCVKDGGELPVDTEPQPQPQPQPEPEIFTCGTSKMIDSSGNKYETVQIGELCWTKTNLRTTKFRNGKMIPEDVDPDQFSSASFSRISPDYTQTFPDSTFGFYYNWYAAADTGDSKLCPEGWHVSNENDWTMLKNYLGTYDYCGSNPTYSAKTLADSLLWYPNTDDCSVGKNPENNNTSGFSAVPAGYLHYGEHSPIWDSIVAYFWTAMPSEDNFAKYYVVSKYLADLQNYTNPKDYLLSVRCVKDIEYHILEDPTVKTDYATNVTFNSAKLNGTVTNPDDVPITQMGFVWKKNTDDQEFEMVVEGAELTATLTNLLPNTSYRYKAYIKYGYKTSYGSWKTFTTPIASVTTDSVTDITLTSAKVYGTVHNPNHVEITEQGFVWKKSHGEYEYTVRLSGDDTALTYTFNGIIPNTKYEYKAFIKYDNRTVYGEELSFTTPNHPEVSCGNMTDTDGNLYQTVVVGSQCWAKTNLRTTKYRDGSAISNQIGTTTPAYYRLSATDKSTDSIVKLATVPDSTFGFYYNGYAAVRDSLCPEGWHVPDTNDWKALIGYLKARPEYWCDNDNSNLAKAVASRDFWFNVETPPVTYTINNDPVPRPCSPQYQDPDYLNDATYFSAIPAGAWYDNLGGNIDTVTGLGGREFDPGKDAHFWSSSTQPGSDSTGYFFRLGFVTYDVVALAYDALKYGRSVRCLRDEPVTGPQAFSCGTSKIIDVDDNHYETVLIGDQCWTKTNLRTTKFRNGEAIPENQDASSATASLYRPAVAEHFTDSIYGMYYNWYAVEGGMLCPAGWHVPTQAEWDQLTTYMGRQSGYWCDDEEPTFIAKALAGTHHYTNQSEETIYAWAHEEKYCAVGSDRGNIAKTNTTGFSAFPAGYWKTTFDGYGQSANFWTSTLEDNQAWVYYLSFSQEMVSSYKEDKETAFSVRCVKN